MKILEIKNNLVKIAYDVNDNLVLSGFVILEDTNTPYVAQVVNLKADITSNFAIVKLLFTFNEEGILKNYNGTIPSLKAKVSVLPSNELLDIFPTESPIKFGTLAQQDFDLNLDKSIFENNLVICSNSQKNTNILMDNLIRQFELLQQKTVIFDIDGSFENEQKITFGRDFKLPLNYETINFIYENDLDDIDASSKAIIQDIFFELQEYTKTLPEGFIPFETFFSVVDSQYKETGITQLVLLKNKLLKYREAEVFALNLKDVLNLNIMIDQVNTAVIDISYLSPKLQNQVILYTYEVMSKIKQNIYSFVKAENGIVTKNLIKKFLNQSNISTTVICGHDYKYLTQLKENAENLILFAPQSLQHDFASYNTFLNKLNGDEYIIYGELTQNIPLIVQLETIEVNMHTLKQQVIPMPQSVPAKEELQIEQPVEENFEEETVEETIQEEPIFEETKEIILEDDINDLEEVNEILIEDEPEQDIIIQPILEEEPEINIDETISEEIIELDEEPVIDEMIEDEEMSVEIEELEQEPIQEDLIIEETEEIIQEPEMQTDLEVEEPEDFSNDELTEEDLNYIEDIQLDNSIEDEASDVLLDAVNDVTEEYKEEELPVDDLYQEEPIPVVPVYPADDIENKEVTVFEPGQTISHPKYGKGIVEKMIKYGNKTLCSINFHNIGRRLLDPAVSELHKI